jgi:hypothetical protein
MGMIVYTNIPFSAYLAVSVREILRRILQLTAGTRIGILRWLPLNFLSFFCIATNFDGIARGSDRVEAHGVGRQFSPS